MSWLSRTDIVPNEYLHADNLNFLGLDIRNWGGDVNAGGYRLSNVIFQGSGSFENYVSPMQITPGAGGGSYVKFSDASTPEPIPRWVAGKDGTAETGSNTGSNYEIVRFSDTGTQLGTPVSINRATGLITLGSQYWTGSVNANGQTLSNVNIPGYATDPTTARGDVIVRGASALIRIPVGADGEVLMADAAQPAGVKWFPNPGAVASVFGRTGVVTAATTAPFDYTAAQVQDAVDKSASYSDPVWITSIHWDKVKATAPSFALASTNVFAGTGMTGGGPLTGNVTLNANVTTVFGRTGDVVLTAGDIAGGGGVTATRQVIAGAGLGGGGALSADVTLTANVVTVFGRAGAITLLGSDIAGAGGVLGTRLVQSGTGLTGGGDLSADRTLAVLDDTTTQRTVVSKAGTLIATRKEINFLQGANVLLSINDQPAYNRVDVTIAAAGGENPGPIDPTTTLGDLIVRGLTELSRLPVGANGEVLMADSAQPLAVRWAPPPDTGQPQSPWLVDQDADGHILYNVGSVNATGVIKTTSGGYEFPDATTQSTAGVLPSRTVNPGAGMTGGGPLSADVTLNADVVSVQGRTGAVMLTTSDITGAGGVPETRRVNPGPGMSGGGPLSADVTLNALVTSVFGRTGDVVLTDEEISGAGGIVDPTTTKGDLLARSATALSRFGVGTDGHLLIADSTQPLGLRWNAPPNPGQMQTPWTQDIDAYGFRLLNVGHIGVGTNNPPLGYYANPQNLGIITSLGVDGSSLALGNKKATAAASDLMAVIDFWHTGQPEFYQVGARIIGYLEGSGGANGFASSLRFQTKSDNGTCADRLFIASSGNIGIGTTTPLELLQVRGGADRNIYLGIGGSSLVTGIVLGAMNDAGTANTPLEIRGTPTILGTVGNVGVGTTAPTHKLHVVGNLCVEGMTGNSSIYTWNPADPNWRMGMHYDNAVVGFARSTATSYVQYVNFHGSGPNTGFVVGDVSDALSTLEVFGAGNNHNIWVRGHITAGQYLWCQYVNTTCNNIGAVRPDAIAIINNDNYIRRQTPADFCSVANSFTSPHGEAIKLAWALPWKNYGQNHVIFDASNGTSPSGTAISSSVNPEVNWTASYPTLMGWNGGNTFGVRVDTCRYADSAGSVSGGAGSWVALTLQNGWVDNGGFFPPQCRKDALGVVHIRFAVKNGANADGTVITTVPVGYRPGYETPFTALSGNASARVQVDTAGQVKVGFAIAQGFCCVNIFYPAGA